MEQSGRNQSQPVANASPGKPRKQAQTVATGCAQLPIDGKEGVDGSSPSEGFVKAPAYRLLPLAGQTTVRSGDVHETSTAPKVGDSARV